ARRRVGRSRHRGRLGRDQPGPLGTRSEEPAPRRSRSGPTAVVGIARLNGPRVSVVIVAYGAYPALATCVRAVLDSEGVEADVVLVDNGCTDGGVDGVRGEDAVVVVDPHRNLGFAGGAVAGASAATGEFLAFVNPDAVVAPHALARLVAVAAAPDVGIASASLRLADEPATMNSAGNPVH